LVEAIKFFKCPSFNTNKKNCDSSCLQSWRKLPSI